MKSTEQLLRALRQEWISAYREGLGVENPPIKALEDELEDAFNQVYRIFVQASLARSMKIERIWMAALGAPQEDED